MLASVRVLGGFMALGAAGYTFSVWFPSGRDLPQPYSPSHPLHSHAESILQGLPPPSQSDHHPHQSHPTPTSSSSSSSSSSSPPVPASKDGLQRATEGCVHFSLAQAVCDGPPKYHPGMRGYDKAPVRHVPREACQMFVRVFESCPGRNTRELTHTPVSLARKPAKPLRVRASGGRTSLWRSRPISASDPSAPHFHSKVPTL